jgi:cell division protease FtsH
MPEEDRVSYHESQITAQLYWLMGGRAAERLIYDDLSTGAAMDLDQATRLARRMVTQWGMSEKVGPVSFRTTSEHPFLGREMSEPRDHSEHMQQIIDEEVARVLREADEHAYRLLEEHRDELERLTEALVEREVLTEAEITELIGKRVGSNSEASVSRTHDGAVVTSLDNIAT